MCLMSFRLASSILESIKGLDQAPMQPIHEGLSWTESPVVLTEHQGHPVLAGYVCSHGLERFQMFPAFFFLTLLMYL